MKNLIKNNRAVSNVISSMILIGVTIVLGIAMMAFSQYTINGQHKTMGENLTIEKVQVTGTTIRAYVRSIGDSPLTLSYVTVNGKTSTVSFDNGFTAQISANGQNVTITGFAVSSNYLIQFVTTSYRAFPIQVKP